jgi:hypothetical protein
VIVKIYWAKGGLDEHRIPEYTGEVQTNLDEKSAKDRSISEADFVSEIIERVRASEDGVYLERYKRVRAPKVAWVTPGISPQNGSKGMCIVGPEDMDDVLRVTVDDEQIWPEPEEDDLASELLASLRDAIGQVSLG